jgi:hypothetical protein
VKPTPVILCDYCNGKLRTFAAKNPHANNGRMRGDLYRGCCRYWLARGIPDGWWT